MTKLLAFSPVISGKPVLLSVIPGKLAMLPAISDKSAFPRQFQTTKNCIQLPSFQTDCCNAVFLFSVFLPSGFCIQVDFISGSHTQANHNFRLSHSSQSQFQALTPRPITISGSHTQANHNFRLSHLPGDLLDLLFLQITITISLDQFFQFFYFLLKFFALIRIPHQHTLF